MQSAGLLEGVVQRADALAQRRAIAKAITLLESTRADHRAQADELLTALLPHTGKCFAPNATSLPIWRRWMNLIRRDQWMIWFGGCVLGMAIPSVVSLDPAYRDTVKLIGGDAQQFETGAIGHLRRQGLQAVAGQHQRFVELGGDSNATTS